MSLQLAKLPAEILTEILTHFRAANPLEELANASLVSRRWYEVVSTVLFEHVTLDARSLATFVGTAPQAHMVHVRSMSISLEDREVSDACNASLHALASFLGLTKLLRSFSIIITGNTRASRSPGVTGLAKLVGSIPPACKALEVEVQAQWLLQSARDQHLCPRIQKLIPQLRSLRVCLARVCVNAVVQPPHDENTRALALRSLVINCTNPSRSYDNWSESHPLSLVAAMDAAIARGNMPALQQAYIVDDLAVIPGKNRLRYETYVRWDVKQRKTTLMPYRRITVIPNFHLMRTPEHPNAVTLPVALNDLAEGHPWCSVERPRGCRLPADAMRTLRRARGRFWATEDESRAALGRKTCKLWSSEKRTGERLLDAESRDGFDAPALVVQRVIPGWMAPITHGAHRETVSDELMKDDGQACAYLAGGELRCAHGFAA